MSWQDQRMLEDCLAIVTGGKPNPRGHWAQVLDEYFGGWRVGRPGSMNRPRLANAIRAHFDPAAAARWWKELLSNEEKGQQIVGSDGRHRNFFYNTYEPMSGIYEGWSLIGEAVALWVFENTHKEAAAEGARVLLRRSIRRHLGMAALFSTPELILRGKAGRVGYRGVACLSPGARTKGTIESTGRTLNRILGEAYRVPASVDPGGRRDLVGQIAKALPGSTWGLSFEDRKAIGKIMGIHIRNNSPGPGIFSALAGDGLGLLAPDAYRYIVAELLPDTKTIVRFQMQRYESRIVAVMHHNPNGNSGATFCAEIPVRGKGAVEGAEIKYLYPYGDATRVRGGHLIGRGSCRQRPFRRFVAENMTVEEESQKGPRARRFVEDLPLLVEPPVVVIEISDKGVEMRTR